MRAWQEGICLGFELMPPPLSIRVTEQLESRSCFTFGVEFWFSIHVLAAVKTFFKSLCINNCLKMILRLFDAWRHHIWSNDGWLSDQKEANTSIVRGFKSWTGLRSCYIARKYMNKVKTFVDYQPLQLILIPMDLSANYSEMFRSNKWRHFSIFYYNSYKL